MESQTQVLGLPHDWLFLWFSPKPSLNLRKFQRFTSTKGLLFYFFYIILQNSCLLWHTSIRLVTRLLQRLTVVSYRSSIFTKYRAYDGLCHPLCRQAEPGGCAVGLTTGTTPGDRSCSPNAAQVSQSCVSIQTLLTRTSPVFLLGSLGGCALQSLLCCCSPVLAISVSSRSHPSLMFCIKLTCT